MSEVLGQCPVCTGELVVVREECTHCGTALEGRFTLPRLLRLAPEQLRFVELFVRCRGVIRDMEQELGVSYPTVRSRLDDVINSLGLAAVDESIAAEQAAERPVSPAARRAVLDDLAAGAMSVDEAVQKLRGQ